MKTDSFTVLIDVPGPPCSKNESWIFICSEVVKSAVMIVVQNEKLRKKKMLHATPPRDRRVDAAWQLSGRLTVATDY